MYVGGPQNSAGCWGPAPLGWDVPASLEIRYCPTCVNISNFVRLDTARGLQKSGKLGPRPWDVGVPDTLDTLSCPTYITTSDFVALGQIVWA